MYQLSIFLVMDAVKLLRAERQRRREAASVSPKSDTKDKGDVDSAPKLAEESPLAKHVRWLSSGPFLPFTSATPLDLSKYRVGSIDSVYYVPDFISAEYGSALVQSSSSSLLLDKWVSLRGRQLQNWGGIPPQSYDAIPRWLQQVCALTVTAGVFPATAPPNHVLVNEYHPGQGIMAHTDGPAYQDCIAIISLRSSVLFRFIPRDSIERCPVETLLLQPNSMLVFTRAATVEYLHDIPEALEDFVDDRVVNCSSAGVSAGDTVLRADTRVSITIRRALYPVSDSGTLCAVSALAQTSPAGSEGPTVDDAVSSWECSVCSPSIRITRCIGELLLSSVPSATGADAAAAFLSVPVDSLAGYTFRVPPGGVLLPEGASSVQAGSLTSISCAVHISSGTDCIVFIPSFSSLPTHTPIELTVYW